MTDLGHVGPAVVVDRVEVLGHAGQLGVVSSSHYYFYGVLVF